MDSIPDPSQLNSIYRLFKQIISDLRENWPIPWSNAKVELWIGELNLGIICDDKDFGTIRVILADEEQNQIGLLEASNGEYRKPEVFLNNRELEEELLYELFQLGRCLREHTRLEDGHYMRGFDYHLKNAVLMGRNEP